MVLGQLMLLLSSGEGEEATEKLAPAEEGAAGQRRSDGDATSWLLLLKKTVPDERMSC